MGLGIAGLLQLILEIHLPIPVPAYCLTHISLCPQECPTLAKEKHLPVPPIPFLQYSSA